MVSETGEAFFEYVVYGRPVSTQPVSRGSGREPKKPSNLPKWREIVREAIEEAWTANQDFFIDSLRLDLMWVYDAKVPNDPDLDNIVKPFIDVLEGRLYEDDRSVQGDAFAQVSDRYKPSGRFGDRKAGGGVRVGARIRLRSRY